MKDTVRLSAPRASGVLVSACLVLTACGNAAGTEIKPKPVPIPTPKSMVQLHLPLEAYMSSDAQDAEQSTLGVLLTRECMRKFGFPQRSTGNLTESIELKIRVSKHSFTRRYGITDRTVAMQFGYGMPDWTIGSAAPQSMNYLSPQERVVLRGDPQHPTGGSSYQGTPIPAGGCTGEAERAVESGGNGRPGLANRLSSSIFLRLRNEPRVLAAGTAWSRCMSSRGYKYPDPWHAGTEFAGEDGDDGHKAGRAEIKSAVASVDCNYETNFIGKVFAVESELQNVEIEKNAETLDQEKKQIDRQARRLQGLVKRYGG